MNYKKISVIARAMSFHPKQSHVMEAASLLAIEIN